MAILMRDFNVKIGEDNSRYEEVMGTHGLSKMNENGEIFADLCTFNKLVIRGSVFHTEESTRQLRYHQTMEPRTRSTISV